MRAYASQICYWKGKFLESFLFSRISFFNVKNKRALAYQKKSDTSRGSFGAAAFVLQTTCVRAQRMPRMILRDYNKTVFLS